MEIDKKTGDKVLVVRYEIPLDNGLSYSEIKKEAEEHAESIVNWCSFAENIIVKEGQYKERHNIFLKEQDSGYSIFKPTRAKQPWEDNEFEDDGSF